MIILSKFHVSHALSNHYRWNISNLFTIDIREYHQISLLGFKRDLICIDLQFYQKNIAKNLKVKQGLSCFILKYKRNFQFSQIYCRNSAFLEFFLSCLGIIWQVFKLKFPSIIWHAIFRRKQLISVKIPLDGHLEKLR